MPKSIYQKTKNCSLTYGTPFNIIKSKVNKKFDPAEKMMDLNDDFHIWMIKTIKYLGMPREFATFMLMNCYQMEDGEFIFSTVNRRSASHFFSSFDMPALVGMYDHNGQPIRELDNNEGCFGDEPAYEFKPADSFEEIRVSMATNFLFLRQRVLKRMKDIEAFTNFLIDAGNALENKVEDAKLYYVPPEISAQLGITIEISSDVYGSILFANDNIDDHDEKGDDSLLQKNNTDNKPRKKGKKNKNRRNRGKGVNDKALKKEQDDKKDNDDEEDWDEMFNWLHVQQ